MIISHNIPALITHLNLRKNDRLLAASTRRLSTGVKISSAKDDAAGLSIANKLSYQVAGLGKASQNATHGISMIQTAEGALNEVHNMLQRMRELTVQAATGTLESEDRANIQTEINELLEEISAIANRTEFNKIKLLNGEANRVAASYYGNQADKTISTALNFSDNVPAGTLSYTIQSVGLPPQVIGVIRDTGARNANGADGSGEFSINGEKIKVDADESYASVMKKITEACSYAGISYEEVDVTEGSATGKALLLTGNVAGSNYHINVSGDPNFLKYFGLQPSQSEGTDAVITNVSMRDESNAPINNFNNGMAVKTDGNQITVTGTGGQVIQMNIQVLPKSNITTWTVTDLTPAGETKKKFQADPANFSYGNGITSAANGTTTTVMELSIQDYGPIMLQIGPSYNEAMSVQIPRLTSETLGFVEYKGGKMYNLLNLQASDTAQLAFEKLDNGIAMVSNIRSRLGAYQNRLESTVRSLDTAAENTEASRSRIQDTDMAREMTSYSQYNVMYQAGLAILSQANQRPMQVLSLLQ